MENVRKMIKQGVVVSDKNDKSIVVRVQRQYIHPLYKKTVRRHKTFMAHDDIAFAGFVVLVVSHKLFLPPTGLFV